MSNKTVTGEQVRDEHLNEVNVPRHWLFLGSVVFGSLAFMIVLIALLGSGAA